MTKLITIAVAYLLVANVQAQNLQGKWSVEKVSIEKNTDGKVKKTVYKSAAEVKSYIPCPQEWEVKDSKTITLRYADGREEPAEYTMEGNQLKIMTATAMQLYQYSIKGKSLTLTTTHNYVNNLPTGHTERIEEKWTMVLK